MIFILLAQTRLFKGLDGLLHGVEGEGEEAGETHYLGTEPLDLLDEHVDRHVDADVEHVVSAHVEHERHDVLADVMDVSRHRADEDLALLLRLPGRP